MNVDLEENNLNLAVVLMLCYNTLHLIFSVRVFPSHSTLVPLRCSDIVVRVMR